MRIKLKDQPRKNEIRTVTKFLLFPKKIKREIRWLEKASYSQYYYKSMVYHFWIDSEWIKIEELNQK